MIAVLGGLADVERDLIRTRTAEGRSRAKARGQHMGRPPALTPQQQAEARKRRSEGATLKELAQSCGFGIATIPRLHRGRRDNGQKGSLLSRSICGVFSSRRQPLEHPRDRGPRFHEEWIVTCAVAEMDRSTFIWGQSCLCQLLNPKHLLLSGLTLEQSSSLWNLANRPGW